MFAQTRTVKWRSLMAAGVNMKPLVGMLAFVCAATTRKRFLPKTSPRRSGAHGRPFVREQGPICQIGIMAGPSAWEWPAAAKLRFLIGPLEPLGSLRAAFLFRLVFLHQQRPVRSRNFRLFGAVL
jgi:hypothetical protein